MWFLDAILNIAGLVLWLKWLDHGKQKSAPCISLVSTLKRSAGRFPRTGFLAALITLLTFRCILYWQLGSELRWIPKIWFGIVALPFRSDYLARACLYSGLSFAAALFIFYLGLLLFSLLEDKESQRDGFQNLVRDQLGKAAFLPTALKLILPWIGALVLWCALNRPLIALGILPAPKSLFHLLGQGGVTSLGVYFVWKYIVVGVLLLHLLNSYIYFGTSAFWIFIEHAARKLLKFISWLPLRVKRIDFAPVIMMAVLILGGEYAARALVWLYQHLGFRG